MATANLPTNSDKFVNRETNVEPVKGNVMVKKKSEISKIAKDFFPEEAANVKHYILSDILVPSLKKLLEDIITNGINALLWGDTKRGNPNRYGGSTGRVSYREYYDRPAAQSYYRRPNRVVYGYDIKELFYETQSDAQYVIDELNKIIRTESMATVADFYQISKESTCPNDFEFGWITPLRDIQFYKDRSGVWGILGLPKPVPIDNNRY